MKFRFIPISFKPELPISEDQIEICDFILGLDNNAYVYEECDEKFNHSTTDVYESCTSLLYREDLITSTSVLKFSIKGGEYRKKGIVKYIKYKNRKERYSSPFLKFWLLAIPIIISLVFNTVNYINNNKIKADAIDYENTYKYVDSVLSQQNKKLYKLTVNDSLNEAYLDSIYNILEFHDSIFKSDTVTNTFTVRLSKTLL